MVHMIDTSLRVVASRNMRTAETIEQRHALGPTLTPTLTPVGHEEGQEHDGKTGEEETGGTTFETTLAGTALVVTRARCAHTGICVFDFGSVVGEGG